MRQQRIPGTEPDAVPEIDEALAEYCEAQDTLRSAQDAFKRAQVALIGRLMEIKTVSYQRRLERAVAFVKLSLPEPTVSVKLQVLDDE